MGFLLKQLECATHSGTIRFIEQQNRIEKWYKLNVYVKHYPDNIKETGKRSLGVFLKNG